MVALLDAAAGVSKPAKRPSARRAFWAPVIRPKRPSAQRSFGEKEMEQCPDPSRTRDRFTVLHPGLPANQNPDRGRVVPPIALAALPEVPW